MRIKISRFRYCRGYLNEWMTLAGILAIVVAVVLALPGKWSIYVGIPLAIIFAITLFMGWLEDPRRIAKKNQWMDKSTEENRDREICSSRTGPDE